MIVGLSGGNLFTKFPLVIDNKFFVVYVCF